MSRPEIAPFSDEHLDAAATLLTSRHARHRLGSPVLSPRYEETAATRESLEAAWRVADASGAVALSGGRVVGFLVGSPRPDPVWGPNVWVESAGHAAEEPETIRDLYALAAERWVEEGRTRHHVLVPATDAATVGAWFRLSFGQQHAHGAREVGDGTTVAVPAGVDIREPALDDVEALIDVDLALPEHQRRSPVFSTVPPPSRDELRQDWIETLAAGDEKLLVACAGGRTVACWAVVPVERSLEHRDLARPDRACCLGFAATLPEHRGAGIGVALTDAALGWAAEQGYEAMVTDWRVTNLLSSRFWPRRGFGETFLRLYRSIP